ncbi:hypothetical protein [Methylocella sp. CPCC 101449]|uniref:hypothetical protein n=1 Tax=Methylocella sp. CPCC 101449 TaxID=2987531 RepID=UPI00288DC713|nr:hypothetical protein [Methylocella sp. CPCC 101449]MDT2022833.1 hypothetical protein [Methylocella sp. CPCC 101449]
MARRAERATEAVFVSKETAAARLEISIFTFDEWRKTGFIPAPHINRGQILRWHWPSIEAKILAERQSDEIDPCVLGVMNMQKDRQRTVTRKRPAPVSD